MYTLIEYTKTVMFMWMFVEGYHLHKTLVSSVFTSTPNYALYYIAAWGRSKCRILYFAVAVV